MRRKKKMIKRGLKKKMERRRKGRIIGLGEGW